jgi:hypothetical protein
VTFGVIVAGSGVRSLVFLGHGVPSSRFPVLE